MVFTLFGVASLAFSLFVSRNKPICPVVAFLPEVCAVYRLYLYFQMTTLFNKSKFAMLVGFLIMLLSVIVFVGISGTATSAVTKVCTALSVLLEC